MSTIAIASHQLLLDTINRDNGLTDNPLTLNEIGLGLPVPSVANDASFNTYCTIYGLFGRGYYGSVQLKYRRYELDKMFLGLTPTLIDPNLTPVKVSDLLPLFNEYYGVALTESDIVDRAFPANTKDILTDLVAKDSNWAWLGSIKLRFAQTLPFLSDEIIPKTDLDAIKPVLPFTAKPRAEYVTYGYNWTDASSTLSSNLAAAGKAITADQMAALQAITTMEFTLATGSDIPSGAISLAGAKWGGPVTASSSLDYNSTDYTYVNTLVLSADSNYEGTLIFHYNVSA